MAPTIARRFGERVRYLRKLNSWTQAELADRLTIAGMPIHQTTVAKLEAGTRPTTLAEAEVFSQVLGVDLVTLIANQDELVRERLTLGDDEALVVGAVLDASRHASISLDVATRSYADAEMAVAHAKDALERALSARDQAAQRLEDARRVAARAAHDVSAARAVVERKLRELEDSYRQNPGE